ncbi:membrane-anchored junction protein isoform X2 [Silurus meridionalis]|uniref:membrane-anchored junction protein isoform X2 n=1 Tax=Silurus meridionalis TaxID=175797 RepID=UPI001EEB7F62|nr:membrane-anchored junction protein isoform X2 [Silurus meridionalis]
MPIQAFSFPIPETRFFHVGQLVYKFKIRRGSQISGEEEMLESEVVNEELENAVRVVLMSLENLHPFTTQHFNIFPYKSRWERVSELRFWKGEKKLFAYPFLIILYVETNQWIPPLTVSHANKWVPSDRESGLDSPHLLSSTSCGFPLANAHRRNEKPQADCLTSSHQHDKMDPHLCLQELPNLSEGAEGTVCDDEEYADSEESSPETLT